MNNIDLLSSAWVDERILFNTRKLAMIRAQGVSEVAPEQSVTQARFFSKPHPILEDAREIKAEVTLILFRAKQEGFELTPVQQAALQKLRAEVLSMIEKATPGAPKKNWDTMKESSKEHAVSAQRMFKQWAKETSTSDETKPKPEGHEPSKH